MKLNFDIKPIDKVDAINFVQKYHYSPVMPVLTKYFLGFHLEGKLVGVLTLGWGTQPRHTFNKMFPSLGVLDKYLCYKNKWVHDINDFYYEIGKMCLSPHLNDTKGAGSQMVSGVVKWMKQNTNCLFLYTMADGIMGKCGYVYQASNFYFGEKYWTQVYMMENGEKLHPRSTKKLCAENLVFMNKGKKRGDDGYREKKLSWLSTDFMKTRGISKVRGYMFRYIYPLSKKAKYIMKNESTLEWSIEKKDYPKSKILEWISVTDKKNKEKIEQPAFTFETAKYNLKNINQGKATLLEHFK